ncbi:alginate O-acetyltransferase AlgX-related protein [Kordia jejudonensis]|uniref:alginate O-acetyltransferase AlgX-related protein n=1 Tax=Kordia jejudonensis TaxID=1348245 RepID=UPI00062950CA|nr:SGNH/GDSL hydrolase family protein [Kordia jejudonensis]
MKNFLHTLKKYSIIFVITLILLEIGSYIVLRVTSSSSSTTTENTSSYTHIPLTIYKQQNDEGVIQPIQTAVVPVKENYESRWAYREFNVSVKTNAKGLRENETLENHEVDIAFFGDSFTFGHGVEVDERYSNILAASDSLQKYKVANYAYLSGFQPEHYEFFIRNNKDLQAKHVVVGMYIGNDLASDIQETNYDRTTNNLEIPMRMISEEGSIYNAPKLYIFPINKLIKYSYFTKLVVKMINRSHYRAVLFENLLPNVPNSIALETGQESIENNRGIIALQELDNMISKRGGKLTVLLIPQNYFFSKKNPHIHPELKDKIQEVIKGDNVYKAIQTELTKRNIDFFDPMPVLSESSYFDEDAHWNKKGHKEVGEALANHIEKLQK